MKRGGILLAANAEVNGRISLNDLSHIRKVLKLIAKKAGMEILSEVSAIIPCSPDLIDSDEDDGGISMSCIISTSAIHIHTWPQQNRFRLIVDSCKDFDVGMIKAVILSSFNIDKVELVAWDVRPYIYPEDQELKSSIKNIA